ncbi:hypothetical protein [Solwaraspora sp. WMMA2101]|uniref:hypothetical protein n=1 Tax=Solwaraspora sp. WMMA2101 TaxID=3404124 RepID=UPI003B94EA30
MSRGSLVRLVMLALLWGSGFLWIKLPPGVPVIVLLHASYDNDGFPFEATRYIMRSDAMRVQYLAMVAA